MLLKYLLVPLACIKCSVYSAESGARIVPTCLSTPNEKGQEDSPPGRWHQVLCVATLLGCPGDSALLSPRVLEPVLRLGARLEGCCCIWKWSSWSCCSSAFEEQRVEPEPCPTSKHQADGSRSPAVHCYPHFSMLCSWEAGCTDWIPLGSSGELGSWHRVPCAPQSQMCLRGFTLSRLCLLQTTDFTPASYATKKAV